MAHMWEWHGKTSNDMVLMWGPILESVCCGQSMESYTSTLSDMLSILFQNFILFI